MLQAGQSLHPASSPASQPNPGASLPGPLAVSRTELAPAGNDEFQIESDHIFMTITLSITGRAPVRC